ncbi:hypothetical protein F511_15457 [Dorcoceras hygrometricum]|uniref:Uncharacterized protein n=1 Tax=Dorcoceras hygrometricum TaxID=472368 RepID=A0A2Z7CK34_9LAMI|nr:hypothetical protein F511_15457 [Dorcoceras hygrometricum]
MVKRLAISPHDPLDITDSACKNQLVVVSVQYGPFNTYIPIRSTTIGKSRVARDPIAMHTSWRSNSDIASVTRQTHLLKTHPVLWPEIYHTIVSSDNIGYPRMRASGESSTTKHRLLHASGPHPIPPPNDPKEHCDVLSMQIDSDLVIYRTTLVRTFQVSAAPLLSPPLSAASPPKCRRPAAAYVDRTCSDQLDEKFPSVLNSSVLLVQADEGVLNPVVDLIDDLSPPTV